MADSLGGEIEYKELQPGTVAGIIFPLQPG
jgi:hypothetical protein